jgi:hypothetical protein
MLADESRKIEILEASQDLVKRNAATENESHQTQLWEVKQ